MKILLDECAHAGLKRALVGHSVRTVPEMDWRGITNGKLLAKAATEFDVFLTLDKNIEFQQNLSALPLPVIAIHSTSLLWHDIVPFVPRILDLMAHGLEPRLYRLE